MNKKIVLGALIIGAMSSSVTWSKSLTVDFSLPEFSSNNYNKPYVAIWAETDKKNETLLLWHSSRGKEDKWLVDIRRWWRKVGRYNTAPADALTGATKGPGSYQVNLDTGNLKQFNLMIEVVREDGGRSLLRQPIDVSTSAQYTLSSDVEIGQVKINIEK